MRKLMPRGLPQHHIIGTGFEPRKSGSEAHVLTTAQNTSALHLPWDLAASSLSCASQW